MVCTFTRDLKAQAKTNPYTLNYVWYDLSDAGIDVTDMSLNQRIIISDASGYKNITYSDGNYRILNALNVVDELFEDTDGDNYYSSYKQNYQRLTGSQDYFDLSLWAIYTSDDPNVEVNFRNRNRTDLSLNLEGLLNNKVNVTEDMVVHMKTNLRYYPIANVNDVHNRLIVNMEYFGVGVVTTDAEYSIDQVNPLYTIGIRSLSNGSRVVFEPDISQNEYDISNNITPLPNIVCASVLPESLDISWGSYDHTFNVTLPTSCVNTGSWNWLAYIVDSNDTIISQKSKIRIVIYPPFSAPVYDVSSNTLNSVNTVRDVVFKYSDDDLTNYDLQQLSKYMNIDVHSTGSLLSVERITTGMASAFNANASTVFRVTYSGDKYNLNLSESSFDISWSAYKNSGYVTVPFTFTDYNPRDVATITNNYDGTYRLFENGKSNTEYYAISQDGNTWNVVGNASNSFYDLNISDISTWSGFYLGVTDVSTGSISVFNTTISSYMPINGNPRSYTNVIVNYDGTLTLSSTGKSTVFEHYVISEDGSSNWMSIGTTCSDSFNITGITGWSGFYAAVTDLSGLNVNKVYTNTLSNYIVNNFPLSAVTVTNNYDGTYTLYQSEYAEPLLYVYSVDGGSTWSIPDYSSNMLLVSDISDHSSFLAAVTDASGFEAVNQLYHTPSLSTTIYYNNQERSPVTVTNNYDGTYTVSGGGKSWSEYYVVSTDNVNWLKIGTHCTTIFDFANSIIGSSTFFYAAVTDSAGFDLSSQLVYIQTVSYVSPINPNVRTPVNLHNNYDGTYTLSAGGKSSSEYYVISPDNVTWQKIGTHCTTLLNMVDISNWTQFYASVTDSSGFDMDPQKVYVQTVTGPVLINEYIRVDLSFTEISGEGDNNDVTEFTVDDNGLINANDGVIDMLAIQISKPAWFYDLSNPILTVTVTEEYPSGSRSYLCNFDLSNNVYKSATDMSEVVVSRPATDFSDNFIIEFHFRQQRFTRNVVLINVVFSNGQQTLASMNEDFIIKPTVSQNPGNNLNNIILPNLCTLDLLPETDGIVQTFSDSDQDISDLSLSAIVSNTWRQLNIEPDSSYNLNVARNIFIDNNHYLDLSNDIIINTSHGNGYVPIVNLNCHVRSHATGNVNFNVNWSNSGLTIDLSYFTGILDIQYHTYTQVTYMAWNSESHMFESRTKNVTSDNLNTLRIFVLPRPQVTLDLSNIPINLSRADGKTRVTETVTNMQMDLTQQVTFTNCNWLCTVSNDVTANIRQLLLRYLKVTVSDDQEFINVRDLSGNWDVTTLFDVSNALTDIEYGSSVPASYNFTGYDISQGDPNYEVNESGNFIFNVETTVYYLRNSRWSDADISNSKSFTIYILDNPEYTLTAQYVVGNYFIATNALQVNDITFVRYASTTHDINLVTDEQYHKTVFIVLENGSYGDIQVRYASATDAVVTIPFSARGIFQQTIIGTHQWSFFGTM